jgi:hypothetical protein
VITYRNKTTCTESIPMIVTTILQEIVIPFGIAAAEAFCLLQKKGYDFISFVAEQAILL